MSSLAASYVTYVGFPDGTSGKEPACQSRTRRGTGSIPGLGRSPGGGHGDPLQDSCLENPHGQRSLEGYSPRGHKESDTTEWLSIAYVAVRGLASMYLSISCHQLLMASHCTPHPQGSRLLRSLGWEDPLEEEMATHSSILAWEVPWTEEPGGLEFMGVTKSQTRLSTPSGHIWTKREDSVPQTIMTYKVQ